MKGREKVVRLLLSSLMSLNFFSFFRGWLIVRDTMILLFKGQRLFFVSQKYVSLETTSGQHYLFQ